MNTINIGNIVLGEGRPKICLPIVGRTINEIIEQAMAIAKNPVDIVEWRADWFEGIKDFDATCEAIDIIRGLVGITPILYTIRTAKEGGEIDLTFTEYSRLLMEASVNPNIDAVDVEIVSADETTITSLISNLKATTTVIASSHDFAKTPSRDDIVNRLSYMEKCGAQVCKMAVMPQSIADVLTLLDATEVASQNINQPIITMSMGKWGLISRLAGEVFGSTLTFGCVGKASAPGQIAAAELSTVLEIIHKNSSEL